MSNLSTTGIDLGLVDQNANPLPRILHCPQLVGGHATEIARHERLLGAQSWSVSLRRSAFGLEVDEFIWPDGASRLRQEVDRWRLFMRALRKFDVVHYNFGTPILNWGALDSARHGSLAPLIDIYAALNWSLELPLLKYLGKVVAVTYQGDDARQGDYSREHFEYSIATEVDETYYNSRTDAAKRKRIDRFAKYADLIYALNPDLLHVLPTRAKFLPYAHVDPAEWQPSSAPVERSRRLIVHAPSHRAAKGTEFLLAAVERLRGEGEVFDFQLVEGLQRSEARAIYERADLVVDQLLAGWYGGFATEAMALGKPVICYLREGDLKFIPADMRRELPIISANPANIEDVLRDWINRPTADIRAQGVKSRQFVERWHDPSKIAAEMLRDYVAVQSARGEFHD